MVVWVAAHFADAFGEAVAHTKNGHLADGVLFKEFDDEVLGVAKG